MNNGKYVFTQVTSFLPKRVFDSIVARHQGDNTSDTLVVGIKCSA